MQKKFYLVLFTLLWLIVFLSYANATTYDLNTYAGDLNIVGSSYYASAGYGGLTWGDADSDGRIDDLLVTQYYASCKGRSSAGVAYLILDAATKTGIINLATTTNIDLNICAAAAYDFLGKWQPAFGDADNDGYKDDLVITAENNDAASTDAGAAYLLLDVGKRTGQIDLLVSTDYNARITGSSDFTLGGAGVSFGDIDNDGYEDDIVLSAPAYCSSCGGTPDIGKVYGLLNIGNKRGSINIDTNASGADVNFAMAGPNSTNAYTGYGTIKLIDVDGDGYKDDLLVGTLQYCNGGNGSPGLSLIKNIQQKGTSNTLTTANLVSLTVCGITSRDESNDSIALADLNNDGKQNDLFVGIGVADYLSRTDSGIVYLIRDIDARSGAITLSTAGGRASTDLNINGSMAGDHFGGTEFYGGSAIAVGDYDSDGAKDLLVAAPYADPLGRSNAGVMYLIKSINSKTGSIDLNNPGTNVSDYFYGPNAPWYSYPGLGTGQSNAFADTDFDGKYDDIIMASPFATVGSNGLAGMLWLIKGMAVNYSPDINILKIDSRPDNAALPSFSYSADGNLTIDFNVSDPENNSLTLDVNYSTSNAQGTGTILVSNLSLSTPGVCADTNFSDSTACTYDWNISGVNDGNYYILMAVKDGSNTNFEATDNNFRVVVMNYKLSAVVSSKKINLGVGKDFNVLNFDVSKPGGTNIVFRIRTADSNANLSNALWCGPSGTCVSDSNYSSDGDVYSTSGTTISSIHDGNSWVQWRAFMSTNTSSATPIIYDVNVLTKNKISGTVMFVFGSSSRVRQWLAVAPIQSANGGVLNWFYCLSWPCTSWVNIGPVGGNIVGSSNYLYLKCDMNANTTNNVTPTVSGASLTYEQ